jgi:hypothetical protein
MRRLTKILGAVVAPTTLVTALLYYFGWSHAYWFFDYFGVDSSVLGLTTRDYLMRSMDALFVPMTVAAVAGLMIFFAHDLLRRWLAAGTGSTVLRILVPVIGGVGFVAAVGGVWSVFTRTFLSEHLVLAPLSLAFGVVLLAYALHLWRTFSPASGPDLADARAEWTAVAELAVVFALVGLGLFWAANDYAAAVGRSRAEEFVAGLPDYPAAVVYSERGLSLHAPGLRETQCHDPGAGYRFRYDGLRLMLQSGSQYVFLPQHWTPADGVAVLIPRTDSVRLEFMRPAAGAVREHAAC